MNYYQTSQTLIMKSRGKFSKKNKIRYLVMFFLLLLIEEIQMVQVKVNEGILRGEEVVNVYGGKFYSFKGVPYAEAPLGDLRFKAPQQPKPWNGVRCAEKLQSACIQRNLFTSEIEGSEDCLYLNIYTPNLNPVKPYPILFWIHGGGFIVGSGSDDTYGPEFIVKEDVILVTTNYRLGALGFLSLNTEKVPGNAGMKDQVAALRWVKENIKKFGGDPETVTIAGESAGGASAAFHLLSPMSKGLFKRAIPQSGVSTCWWANNFQARKRAITLAKMLNFYSENDEDLYDFFKSQPAEDLVVNNLPITYAETSKRSFQLYFGVVSEMQFPNNERFFHGDVLECIHANINNIDIMVGYNEDEAYLDLNFVLNLDEVVAQANQYYEFFVPPPITIDNSLKEQLIVGEKIKKFYFRHENITRNDLDQLIRYSSNNIFVYWIIQWAKAYAMNKCNVYLYKLTAKTERNIASRFFGLNTIIGNKSVTSHLDNLAYLFPMKSINPKMEKNSDVYKLTETIVKLWTNFVKFGIPTPYSHGEVNWLPYTVHRQDYLEIGNKLVEKYIPEKNEIQFLEEIFKGYYPKGLGLWFNH